jgi:hypothetical protein
VTEPLAASPNGRHADDAPVELVARGDAGEGETPS